MIFAKCRSVRWFVGLPKICRDARKKTGDALPGQPPESRMIHFGLTVVSEGSEAEPSW